MRRTIEETPPDATHWPTRSMAGRVGVSATTVGRIWQTFGLKPRLLETFKISTDPLFVEKVRDVVAMGLISPGPVVIMATFAGYLVDGVIGAVVATLAVFLPVYLLVVVPGGWFRKHEKHPRSAAMYADLEDSEV